MRYLSSLMLIGVSSLNLLWSTPVVAQVNFRSPQRQYARTDLDQVFVERELAEQSPELARKAARRVKENITLAKSLLPEHARGLISRIPFYVMAGSSAVGGGKDTGLEYFNPRSPDYRIDIDLRWRSCVVVYSARNYLSLSNFWALKAVVHEFAHAYHLEQLPENQRDIVAAFHNATQMSLYNNVINNDTGRQMPVAYAGSNHLEYFAELSAIYYVGCNYMPTSRRELLSLDPVGHQMVERLWKVGSVGQPRFIPKPIAIQPKEQELRLGVRGWTDSAGRQIGRGTLQVYSKGTVVLALEQGSVALAFNALGKQEQAYVVQQMSHPKPTTSSVR
ncbi:MAG: hypothetical protein AB8G99_14630 [Planctomycetaceae bacterium]